MTLIGATTENPYFEVNSALISRTHVYELEALTPAEIRVLLDRAVAAGRVRDRRTSHPTRRSSSSPSARAATRARR